MSMTEIGKMEQNVSDQPGQKSRAILPIPARAYTGGIKFSGMGRLTENVVLNLKNKSHSITAEMMLPRGNASGVIIARGGAFAGWSLYACKGILKYCYNLLGLQRSYIESTMPLPKGLHQIRMEFAYNGCSLGKGGKITLYVDGNKVGEGRVPVTVPMIFSAEETTDIGYR